MRLFVPFSIFLQINQAAPSTGSADYDFIDFWDLIKRLEQIKSESEKYKVADSSLNLLEPPTRLKKVGDGIKIDVDKTSGDKVNRKKNKNEPEYVEYDDYYDYAVSDDKNSAISNNGEYDYDYGSGGGPVDDYYFYASDMTTQPFIPPTTLPPTTRRTFFQRPKPQNPVQKLPQAPASAPIPHHLKNPSLVAAPKPSLVAAPKPPNYVNSERQQFADEYYYEYYYEDDEYGEYYYDDLGMKKKKKKKRKKKKKNQYKNNYVAPSGTNFYCWECLSANSYDHCMQIGKYVECNGGSIGCNIEVRSRRYTFYEPRKIEKIHMGCKQLKSCITEHKYNGGSGWHPQCFAEDSTWPKLLQWPHSTCRQCCAGSHCNYQWLLSSQTLETQAAWESTDYHTRVP